MRINSSHSYAERGDDCYFTPPEATRALLAIEKIPLSVCDPCCGNWAILDVLKEAGHFCYGSDIRDFRPGFTVVRDYLTEPVIMNGVAIVSNAPFRLAEQFIRKAIADKCQFHCWLLRTNFLESVSRLALWRDYPPSRVWVSSRRLPMMHRENWNGPRSTSNVAYAWYVWDTGSNDNFKLGVFDWREAA